MTSSPGGPQGEENHQEPLEETPQGSSSSSSRANPTEGPPGTTSCPLPLSDHNRSTASVPQTEWVGVSSSLVNSWTINVSFGIPEKFQPHFLFQSNSSRSHVTELKHSFCGARRGCWWAGGAKELQRPPTLRSFAQETLVCGSRGLVQFQSFRVLSVVSPPLGLLWSQGLFVGAPVKNSPPGGGGSISETVVSLTTSFRVIWWHSLSCWNPQHESLLLLMVSPTGPCHQEPSAEWRSP